MEVTLPSGAKATLRDVFMRGDRRAAKRAIQFTVNADGSRTTDASLEEDITGALLREMVVTWTVPQPLPRDAQNLEMAQQILDRLPDDDYEALAAAVKPHVDKILGRDEDPKSGGNGTGTPSSAGQDGPETKTT